MEERIVKANTGLYEADEHEPTAVDVNAQHLQPFTAVRLAECTGVTVAATKVRFHGTARAHGDAAVVGWRVQDFDAQLVAEDAWIAEERLSSRERVQVRAADPD